jgi:thioredoxin reductase (NADPH)
MLTDKQLAFPTLTPRQIAELRARGTVRSVAAGEILLTEGDRDFSFFVVQSGSVEILEHSSGTERVVVVHAPGEFTGDVDLLSGRGTLVTARVREAGDVIQVEARVLRHIVNELPELGELLLTAFLTRRTLLLSEGLEGIKIIGSRFSPASHQLRDFASRNAIPYTWLDLETDPNAEALLRATGIPPSAMPVVICRDGKWVSNPTLQAFAHTLGLDHDIDESEIYDLVVVGAGPAGLAAAVYASSEGLRTLALDALAAGGQAGTSSRIENYLGFPIGISGHELAQNALIQAQKFGTHFAVPKNVNVLRRDGGTIVIGLEDGGEIRARSLLIASGIEYKRLDVPRLRELEGAGVYYAATEMEARLCGGDEIVIVGGGNSAGQATVFLSRSARKVHLVLRGDDLGKSMSRYLVDRIEGLDNVTLHKCCVVSALEGERALTSVHLTSVNGGPDERLEAKALFIFIGTAPHTGWLRNCVALDDKGFVLTGTAIDESVAANDDWKLAQRAPFFLETSMPGVFAAGDARSGSVKRVASAVGEGSMAISFVHAHLGRLL